MNGSTENRAQGASAKAEAREVVLNLATARRMLPLVQRIIDDVLQNQQRLKELLPEEEQLDRRRRALTWPQRSRRYQIKEEIAARDQDLQEALAELAGLGILLLVNAVGRVGFPTVVNGRRAYFSWQPGEDDLHHWHFPEETDLRAIPASWEKSADITVLAKR
jgi:hypothetical protein